MPDFNIVTDLKTGRTVKRREDVRLTTGHGNYAGDRFFKGMVYAAFARAPHAHAKILSIDTADAKAMPGVVAIFTAADLAADGVKSMIMPVAMSRSDGTKVSQSERPLLVGDRVRFLGEPVAMVLASSLTEAVDAAEAVSVDYDVLPAVVTIEAATAKGAPAIWDAYQDNEAYHWTKGDQADVDAALKASHHVARVKSVSKRVSANPMEPRVAVSAVDNGKQTLFTGIQSPQNYRDFLATMFGMEKDEARVVVGDIGGSFGMKSGILREESLVFWASKRLKKPVKWTASRSDTFLTDDHARDVHYEVELGLDRKGNFTALKVVYQVNLGAYLSGRSTSPIGNMGGIVGVYRTPKVYGQVTGVYTNTSTTAPYRGAGRPEATLVIERAIDVAAREMKIDPFALRMRNLIPPEAMPYKTPYMYTYDCGEFAKTMKRAAELIDYDGFKARRKDSRKRGKLRGLGIANPIEVAGGPWGKESTDHAWVDVKDDGSVVLRSGAISIGQGHETTLADLIAQRLNVPLEKVEWRSGDTDLVAKGKGHGGSSATALCGSAISISIDQIIEKGRKLAADRLETEVADIEFSNGNFRIAGTDRALSLADVAKLAAEAGKKGDGPGNLAGNSAFKLAQPTFPNGCHICEVEIDPQTGEATLLKYVSVEDIGNVINPVMAEGQVHGGVVQGLGQVMKEEIVYDESGQLITGSFMDYGMPRASDIPPMESDYVVVPTALNPLGVKGIGEAGTVGALASAMNAVCDALAEAGVTDFEMPATSNRVWQALQDAPVSR